MKRRFLKITLCIALSMSLCGCSLSNLKGKNNGDSINIETESTESNGDEVGLWEDSKVEYKIDEINNYIENYYYFDIDKETQEEALYDGIMAGLDDPYSVYYTAEEFARFQEDASGEYVGIGAVVSQDENKIITIVRPIKGSPAEEVGLMSDDIVVEVANTDVGDMEVDLVVDMIRGEEGTTVQMKVFRPSEEKYIEFQITRRTIQYETVSSKMLDSSIGYISIEQFYENTGEQFKAAVDELKAAGAIGIICDVRDNPGGLLNVVTDMCDYLMPAGTIVTTKDRNGNIISEGVSTDDDKIDIPVVVLINGNSASASEIFAGAIKDSGVGVLVGTTTFGKGIVQQIIPLSDGTAIKITIAKYFTPNGTDIHKIGITPDYKVELPDGRTNAVNLSYEEDTQLQTAEQVILEMIN